MPIQRVIDTAVRAARFSTCGKSQRGAVVFDPMNGDVYGAGHNSLPADGVCDWSEECRAACGKICVHAEIRALRGIESFGGLDMLHVKVVDGALVAGGGPSCWQCSREILDIGINGFWLYQKGNVPGPPVANVNPDDHTAQGALRGFDGDPRWVRYTAAEFHAATLKAWGLPALALPPRHA